MQPRILKRSLIGAGILVALAVVTIVAISLRRDLHRLSDVRVGIAEASVIAYGHEISEAGRSRVVVDEIWRHLPSGRPLTVGVSLPPGSPTGSHTSGLVLFFSGSEPSPDQIIAVYGDQVPAAGMSLEQFKALCTAAPNT